MVGTTSWWEWYERSFWHNEELSSKIYLMTLDISIEIYCGTISGDFHVKIVSNLPLIVPLRAFYFEPIKLKSPVA